MIDNQLAWVFRLDLAGNMLWQRCLGGSLNDQLWSVAPSGTGCFVAGFTNSYDGDGVGNNGQSDMWVVKLDEAGGTVWSKCFGGSYIDTGRSVAATPDGGCIVAGETRSNDGDVDGINPYYTPPASVYTGWVVKLDAEGNMEWQACHGGPGSELLYAVAVAPDGSYWVAGRTTSTQGDISGHHGGTDGWVFRLGPTGDHTGQRCLGGSGTDEIRGIHVLPNGNALVTGFTNSSDGDVTDQFGSHDLWVILLDPELEIIWQLSLGGSELDAAWHVASAHEGGAVIAGYSASSDGHVPGNNGEADAWVIKLAPWDDIGVAANADPEQFTLFPNPATDMLHLQLPQWHSSPMPWSILDLTGREMAQGLATGERSVVPLGDLARGTYLFQLRDGPGIQVKRFVKQ